MAKVIENQNEKKLRELVERRGVKKAKKPITIKTNYVRPPTKDKK
jgi:hypothetical protein